MKLHHYLSIIGVIALVISCSKPKKPYDLTWLEGTWERTNEKPPKKTYEYWDASGKGKGFSLLEKDTVFLEHLEIVTEDDKIYLQIQGVHETPIRFLITAQTNNSFRAENAANEFPKVIQYTLDNDQLKAQISDDSIAVDFWFKRLQ